MSLISQSGGWRSRTTEWIVWWLSDRVEEGLAVGYTIWWIVASTLDVLQELALEGLFASWPGYGTASALAMIGRSRGMIRGMQESDARYGSRLRQWLTRWQHAGSQANLIQAIHEYVLGQPKCFIVNRHGTRVTVAPDGTMTTDVITWNWDSVSNPERAGYWSDLWLVVFSPPWAENATTLPAWDWPNAVLGYGHQVPRTDVDAIKSLLETGPAQHAAHSYVRAIVWCYDPTKFDSTTPATMPDGTWGQWVYANPPGPMSAPLLSGRFASCRFWEPEPDPNV